MIKELDTRIRERAHKIWEREGRPSDRAEAHWSMASAELAAETAEPVATQPRPRKAAAASAPAAEKVAKPAAPKAAKPRKAPAKAN